MISESQRIRILHAYLGLSACAFAAKLGVGYTTLNSWESGRTIPDQRGCEALARVMRQANLVLGPSGMPVPKGGK